MKGRHVMIQRELAEKTKQLSSQYPVVTITGPRQSGKTTLCRMVFPEMAYASLEDLDQREYARQDPRGFLNRFSQGAVLDEIQHARNCSLTSRPLSISRIKKAFSS